jgi:hypothetical protein
MVDEWKVMLKEQGISKVRTPNSKGDNPNKMLIQEHFDPTMLPNIFKKCIYFHFFPMTPNKYSLGITRKKLMT